MDYTTVERVKLAIHAQQNIDDNLLDLLVKAASRAIDRKCTGVPDLDAVDYFKLEEKTETINGIVNNSGVVIAYPHKPFVTDVTSFEFRPSVIFPWVSVDADRVYVDGVRVEAHPQEKESISSRCIVRVTYTGGLGNAPERLPDDLVEAATVLAARFYKEAESGLSDSVGLAELGTIMYTKAWPIRVLDMIQPYIRQVGWRYVA